MKRDIIREKLSPLYIFLYLYSHSTLISLSLALLISEMFCPFDFLLFMLHNGALRNLSPPSCWSSLFSSITPFLSFALFLLLYLLPAYPVSHFPPLSISLLWRGHHAVILAVGNGSWPQRMEGCKCSTDEILVGDWDCVNQWLVKADQASTSPHTHTSCLFFLLSFHSMGDPHLLFVGKSHFLSLCS